jgi:radical SAM superfamily enzyme YgiQ (UPF0313 family)
MRALLLYPLFPPSFWSFEETVQLIGRKAMLPPLGLVTVAAILPKDWEFKLVDHNVREVTEEEWAWAEIVLVSAMIVQKADFAAMIQEAKRRGKKVAVGGPYPTALPHEAKRAGADYFVLDEGEVTIPLFLEALARGDESGTFRGEGEKPDVTTTPIPRFDLLELDAYSEMSVQFSRGCPFLCEFCDIIVLYGRKPRTKAPKQLLAEFQALYDLGWRRSIFVVDDNFIGNKKNVKLMLNELQPWMVEHGFPFSLSTEASVDLAQDQELLDQMVQCNFGAVFLGVETPDTDSLKLTKKSQNNRDPLIESVQRIARSGIRVMAGFIIGFDNEKPGAGQRIVDFIETAAIPTASFSMLQALPDTGLTKRLAKEGRLLADDGAGDLNQTSFMNFVPTRPVQEIAREYVDGFWDLYDPIKYLDRTYRHYQDVGQGNFPKKPKSAKKKLDKGNRNALIKIFWRQGVVRETRFKFWINLVKMFKNNRGGVGSYIGTLAYAEHFLTYRESVREQIEKQMAHYLNLPAHANPVAASNGGPTSCNDGGDSCDSDQPHSHAAAHDSHDQGSLTQLTVKGTKSAAKRIA